MVEPKFVRVYQACNSRVSSITAAKASRHSVSAISLATSYFSIKIFIGESSSPLREDDRSPLNKLTINNPP